MSPRETRRPVRRATPATAAKSAAAPRKAARKKAPRDKQLFFYGGGTGPFTILKGMVKLIRKFRLKLNAIVSTADSGGASGWLRTLYDGIIPPGDMRQCMLALVRNPHWMILNDRWDAGNGTLPHDAPDSLAGHNLGNILIQMTMQKWGPQKGLGILHRLLDLQGQVMPVTYHGTTLIAELEDGTQLIGEAEIDRKIRGRSPIRRIHLQNQPQSPNVQAVAAIRKGDAHTFGPGDPYTSYLPLTCVPAVVAAIVDSGAPVILVINLATKLGQTERFTARTFVETMNRYLKLAGGNAVDAVIVNSETPSEELRQLYHEAGEELVADDLGDGGDLGVVILRRDLIARAPATRAPNDALDRSLLRHDSDKLAQAILDVLPAARTMRRRKARSAA